MHQPWRGSRRLLALPCLGHESGQADAQAHPQDASLQLPTFERWPARRRSSPVTWCTTGAPSRGVVRACRAGSLSSSLVAALTARGGQGRQARGSGGPRPTRRAARPGPRQRGVDGVKKVLFRAASLAWSRFGVVPYSRRDPAQRVRRPGRRVPPTRWGAGVCADRQREDRHHAHRWNLGQESAVGAFAEHYSVVIHTCCPGRSGVQGLHRGFGEDQEGGPGPVRPPRH